MKKLILVLGGVVVLTVAYWLVSPLFITTKVDETMEDIANPASNSNIVVPTDTAKTQLAAPSSAVTTAPPVAELATVKTGSFEGLASHNAQGTAKLIKSGERYFMRLENDFKVTNGPDLFVHFGKNGEYAAEARLGKLKGSKGGQNYEVPPEINPENYNEVWVWCRAFSVPFGKAVLK